jgi:hypothetical protein
MATYILLGLLAFISVAFWLTVFTYAIKFMIPARQRRG